jgi:hypothetical protein
VGRPPTPAEELEAIRRWKMIAIALAAGCGVVEALILAAHPHLEEPTK